MRSHILLSLFLLVSVPLMSQNFEGKIVYQNTYDSKVPGMQDEQFSSMMGETQEYFIKGGDYKTVMSGNMFQWQLYRSAENKLYMKMSNSPSVFWKDGSENPDEVQKAEINKGVTTILGHECDELVLTCKSGIQKYYFSSKLKVNAELYKAHKFGNFYEFISRSKSLPLKIVMETPQFSLESTAIEIVPKKLSDAEFELPANAPLQKSPY